MEDRFYALDEAIDNDSDLDEIIDQLNKIFEEKGLGDDYFSKIEERLKEMELEYGLYQLAIYEMLNE